MQLCSLYFSVFFLILIGNGSEQLKYQTSVWKKCVQSVWYKWGWEGDSIHFISNCKWNIYIYIFLNYINLNWQIFKHEWLGFLYVVSLDFLNKDQLSPSQYSSEFSSSNHYPSHSCKVTSSDLCGFCFLIKNSQHHHHKTTNFLALDFHNTW